MARKKHRRGKGRSARRRGTTLQSALERGYVFLRAEQFDDALALLEPLRHRHPNSAPLFLLLGDTYSLVGRYCWATQAYERALALDAHPREVLSNLLNLYGALDMPMHALRTARRILELNPDDEPIAALVAELEAETGEVAERFGVEPETAAEGTFLSEAGQLALGRHELDAAVEPLRQAIALVPRWATPRNNLALALFVGGEAEEALELVQEVLAFAPDNVYGLGNMVQFLAIAGERERARPYWERLRQVTTQDEGHLIKIVEAAAYMEEDEEVYRLLRPLFPPDLDQTDLASFPGADELRFLGTAAANLGRQEEARQCWTVLAQDAAYGPWVEICRQALQAGRPGPGWAERFPYFTPTHLVQEEIADELALLVGEEGYLTDEEIRTRGAELARRHPQLVRYAEALIWLQQNPEVGVPLLRTLGTPRAVAALRRYATSQAGPDEGRREALMSLVRLGDLAPDEPIRVWMDGEWREVLVRGSQIGDRAWPYAPELQDLMDQAVQFAQEGRHREAERLYKELIAAEPAMKEAYANLAVLYHKEGKVEQARSYIEKALEIDPLYVFPRCNLALTALGEGEVALAQEWIEPLETLTEFHPLEATFYHYTQARILAAEGQFDEARSFLDLALAIMPDYAPAQAFLEELQEG